MKNFVILIIIFLFKINAYCQESIGYSYGLDYYTNCYDIQKYDIIRSDQYGKIVWKFSVIQDNHNFDFSDSHYIIFGYTYIVNEHIISNPSDYDYWLVEKKKEEDFLVYPNLNNGIFIIYSKNFNEQIEFEINDSMNRLIYKNKIIQTYTQVDLKLTTGFYFVKIFRNNQILKYEKICIN